MAAGGFPATWDAWRRQVAGVGLRRGCAGDPPARRSPRARGAAEVYARARACAPLPPAAAGGRRARRRRATPRRGRPTIGADVPPRRAIASSWSLRGLARAAARGPWDDATSTGIATACRPWTTSSAHALLAVPDRRLDAVSLLDAEEARFWEVPVVFVAGLAQGVFPLRPVEDVLLRDDERERLRRATRRSRFRSLAIARCGSAGSSTARSRARPAGSFSSGRVRGADGDARRRLALPARSGPRRGARCRHPATDARTDGAPARTSAGPASTGRLFARGATAAGARGRARPGACAPRAGRRDAAPPCRPLAARRRRPAAARARRLRSDAR